MQLIIFGLAIVCVVAVVCHDYFTGRRLIRDLSDEFSLWRADLHELDARALANPDRSSVVVSLTSIPSRLPMIGDTIKSLLRQTRLPAEIRLYLPRTSRRESTPYVVPDWLASVASLRICWVDEDIGPATKFIWALQDLGPDAKLLVVDDDRIFPPNTIELLDDAADRQPDAAFCIGGWVVPTDLVDRCTTLMMYLRQQPPAQVRPVRINRPTPIDILMGAHGFIVRPRFFDLAVLTDFTNVPKEVFFADDIWISAHSKVPKMALPSRWADYQPYRHVPSYDRSSLGWINRTGRPETWANTVVLKYFGSAPWLFSQSAKPDA